MKKPITLFFASLTFTGVALAHEGVTNLVVRDRMDGMSSIAENVKILGEMAKGAQEFDAETARQAAANIADLSAAIPSLFEANETDPLSDALPVIWDTFPDFTAQANHLENTATQLATSISSRSDLTTAMRQLGASCGACHKAYRK